jgi:hypothetical protein
VHKLVNALIIKSRLYIVRFNDEAFLRWFIYKILLQAMRLIGSTGYMMCNARTVMTKSGKTRKVTMSFSTTYAHFLGRTDRKTAHFRAVIRTVYFPNTMRECCQLHRITLACQEMTRCDAMLIQQNLWIAAEMLIQNKFQPHNYHQSCIQA